MTASRLVLMVTLTISLLAAPLAADAQYTAGKLPRIGLLALSAAPVYAPDLAAFRQRLRELGYVEGQNVVIEDRYAEARVERLPDLAAELVRLKVDVIVTITTPAALAAKDATATIPIVMAGSADLITPVSHFC